MRYDEHESLSICLPQDQEAPRTPPPPPRLPCETQEVGLLPNTQRGEPPSPSGTQNLGYGVQLPAISRIQDIFTQALRHATRQSARGCYNSLTPLVAWAFPSTATSLALSGDSGHFRASGRRYILLLLAVAPPSYGTRH
jgi:hypothetical protein